MITASAIKEILLHPEEGREWTIQGLGMLRLYLDDEHVYRLHLWDPRLAFEQVSTIHDHPWDFESVIISGQMVNVRYLEGSGLTYEGSELFCGAGGGLLPDTRRVVELQSHPDPVYLTGMRYKQEAPELHDSLPMEGAVTVIKRTFGPNRDIAHVYWPYNTQWGSAEPRAATREEVIHFTREALAHWTG